MKRLATLAVIMFATLYCCESALFAIDSEKYRYRVRWAVDEPKLRYSVLEIQERVKFKDDSEKWVSNGRTSGLYYGRITDGQLTRLPTIGFSHEVNPTEMFEYYAFMRRRRSPSKENLASLQLRFQIDSTLLQPNLRAPFGEVIFDQGPINLGPSAETYKSINAKINDPDFELINVPESRRIRYALQDVDGEIKFIIDEDYMSGDDSTWQVIAFDAETGQHQFVKIMQRHRGKKTRTLTLELDEIGLLTLPPANATTPPYLHSDIYSDKIPLLSVPPSFITERQLRRLGLPTVRYEEPKFKTPCEAAIHWQNS